MADNEIGITITGDISDIMTELQSLVSELEGIVDKVVDLVINVDDSQLATADEASDGVAESLDAASEAANSLGDSIDSIDTTNLDAAKESADGLSESLSGAGSGAEATSSGTGGDMGAGAGVGEGIAGGAAAIGGITIFDDLADAAGEYGDSWARIGSVFGQSASTAESSWSGAVNSMAATTGRRASDIRSYIGQMGIAGVTSAGTLESMFTGVSGAAFATGNSVEGITNAMRRVISTGTLGARQLMTMGLSEQDVMNATGMSLDEVNEKFKGMDSNQRAAFLGNIVNAKYAGTANENYKNSWEHVKDQMGASFDMFMRVFGQMMLPIVIPAMQIVTELVKGLATWFSGLNNNQKLMIGTLLALGLGFITIVGILAVVTTAVGMLNLAFLASPIFWVIMGVVALVAAFLYFYNTNEQFRASIDGLWAAMTGFGAWLQGGFDAIVKGVSAAWNNMVNTIIRSINWFINLPRRMQQWGYNATKGFADGLKRGLKPVTDALAKIGKLFPHSPPEEGPLADITTGNMSKWMGTIATAGTEAIGGLNLNNVGIPQPIGATNTNSSSMNINVSLAGANINSQLDAQEVGNTIGTSLADKLKGQATNAGVSVNNMRR